MEAGGEPEEVVAAQLVQPPGEGVLATRERAPNRCRGTPHPVASTFIVSPRLVLPSSVPRHRCPARLAALLLHVARRRSLLSASQVREVDGSSPPAETLHLLRWGTGVLGMQREPGSSPSLVEQSRVEPVRLLRTREDGRERVREEARKAGRVERAEPAARRGGGEHEAAASCV